MADSRNARNPQPRLEKEKKIMLGQRLASTAIVSLDKVGAERAGAVSRLTFRSCFVLAPRSEFTSPFGDLLRHRRAGPFGFVVLISWTDSLSRRLSLRRDGDAWETKGIGSRHSARAKPEGTPLAARKRWLRAGAGCWRTEATLARCLLKIRRAREESRQSSSSPSPSLSLIYSAFRASTGAIELTLENRIRVGGVAWERGQRVRDAALPITFNYLTSGDAALSYGISRSTWNPVLRISVPPRYTRRKLHPELQAYNYVEQRTDGWKRVRWRNHDFIHHSSLDSFLLRNAIILSFTERELLWLNYSAFVLVISTINGTPVNNERRNDSVPRVSRERNSQTVPHHEARSN